MWREVLRVINEGTIEGLTQAAVPPKHDAMFLQELRHANEVFAAFKVHAMGEEMAAKLFDQQGNLKSFDKWVNDVAGISSHQVGSWLRTEYDTAVIRAHAAADWKVFERNRDIFPNLRWMPTTSPNPEGSHRQYWQSGLTLPIDDPFWNSHHPGDRWNCKCSLEATDEPVVRPADMETTTPQKGLENNPGKDGHIFNDTHPYFPEKCSHCFAKKGGFKNKLKDFFLNANQQKDCHNCKFIDSKMKKSVEAIKNAQDVAPPNVATYISTHNGNVLQSPYHGENEVKENKRLADFIVDKIGGKVYLLPRLDPQNPVQSALRATLLPADVFVNKNPDFLIGGKLFDGKSMMNVVRTSNKKKHHNDILNRIKSAKQQADNVVLEIPTFITRRTIAQTINGYLSQSSTKRVIIVKHGNKCYVYK